MKERMNENDWKDFEYEFQMHTLISYELND